MSPYMLPFDELDGTERPILASIGTVLIDSFESPPRPTQEVTPVPTPLPTPNPTETFPDVQSNFNSIPTPRNTSPLSPSPSTKGSINPTLLTSFHHDITDLDTYDVIGGGALYTLIGARMWLSPERLKTIIDRSTPEEKAGDVPEDSERILESFGDMWVWNVGKGKRMPKARIRYDDDVRVYQHIVKAPHRTLSSLLSTPIYGSTYLHIAPPFSPEDVWRLLEEQNFLRSQGEIWEPRIVFEPTPPSCHPGQREWLERILPGIEVLSPNHEELFSLYGLPKPSYTDPHIPLTVNKIVNHLLNLGIGPNSRGAIVVRCGPLGSCVGTRAKGIRWFPAFFGPGFTESIGSDRVNKSRVVQDGDVGQVVDVTGAGNAFLGGYVAGLYLSDDDHYEGNLSALHATVSASFIVQQFGLPTLEPGIRNRPEVWNRDTPAARLKSLRARMAKSAPMIAHSPGQLITYRDPLWGRSAGPK
ncbi:hypothetical protein TREMEDRAFT_71595 [Tremella mesenterica DSM 1558]|uniref:uncharacterized protein n=1 Tax=Tremella mesenterica (strain ATCC 24925 / CBS 8224 / DSM 1558 / NBRC 9311 / NRRL Y-6157 / RJB 2259-6 / UBC 559-6) TaxID=578456 RepID=UPI0003F494F4|nr:uncharacterized protein TREMEDRAFT_71595 [Tremella mesenterica DSM 1558]EIW69310.1 hypothetical protein TREMEDRAFT_71595 [Tremella mesenterica DSM 1558]